MDEFLAQYYGTAGSNEPSYDADALEKMAQLTLLTKQAEEEGVDLSNLSEEELAALAEEVSKEQRSEGEAPAEVEKEAAAKFEEADFLGRVMAHSMWQELDSIQKVAEGEEAAAAAAPAAKPAERGAMGRAWDWTKGTAGKAHSYPMRLGEIITRTGEGGRLAEWAGRHPGWAKALKGTAGYGVPLGVIGGGAYGVSKLVGGKKKESSAFNSLVERRAQEILAQSGYMQKTASPNDFQRIVDTSALQYLENLGYPVQWNR
jgi:hypothetical protein